MHKALLTGRQSPLPATRAFGAGTARGRLISGVVVLFAAVLLCQRLDGAGSRVVGWGDNSSGQLDVPPGLTNVAAISARGYDSQVLVGDGSPVITVQPFSRVARSAAAVTLHAMAAGAPPMDYQWKFGETNLPGATNATLTLPSAQFSDAGQYRLVVSNAHGNAVSAVATLNIQEYLELLEPAKSGDAFGLWVATFAGRTYILEYTDSLSTDRWTPLAGWSGDGGRQWLTDPAAIAPQRFYRVRIREGAP